jgi:hypothetical protein
MKDPIVEEVRKYRMEHTRKFRADLAAICADLRSIQNESGHKVVRLQPRKSGLFKSTTRDENSVTDR